MADLVFPIRHRPSAADIPPDGKRRIRMTVEFDGTAYSGWQRQLNALSVQEVLEGAMESLTGEHLSIIGSSRTDAGVHALGLVCHLDTASAIPPERLSLALNTRLPEDIRVRESRPAPAGFHARYSAVAKAYSYTFHNGSRMCALGRQYCAHVPVPMDLARMREAGAALLGTHDFSAFAASGSVAKSTVRTLYALRIWREEEKVRIRVLGDGFLYNMVRIIAGTLAEAGTGKRPVTAVQDALSSGRRIDLGPTAPACGLVLERVCYPGEESQILELFDPPEGDTSFSGSGKEENGTIWLK